MNTIRELKKSDLIKAYTDAGFSTETAVAEIDFAIEIISGLTPKDLIIGIMPSLKDIQKLYETVRTRLSTRQPVAQILGYSFFMGCKFEVSMNTLIPRPETELLVKKAVEIIKDNAKHINNDSSSSFSYISKEAKESGLLSEKYPKSIIATSIEAFKESLSFE